MRICVINNVLHDEATLPASQAMVEACGRGVLRAGTSIAIRGLKRAPDTAQTAPDCYRDSYFQLLSTVQIVDAAIAAARQGFDAIIVNCFDDYGVEQARSVVDVPVIGIGSASLFFAAQLARRIGVIVPNLPGQIAFAERQIADLGLSGFLIHDGIRIDDLPFADSWCQALGDPGVATRRFEPLVRALIEDGAGAVVFGCGGFSLVCGAQGFTSLNVAGQDYPVVIPITVALLQAETLVTMHRQQGLPVHARNRGSVLQTPAVLEKLRKDFGL
jgi:Asp/Glu/hydantoin racemase